MANRLTGRIAWIGGGASGIGEATVRLFTDEGATVCFADVQTDRGARLAQELNAKGKRVLFTPCDVGVEEEVKRSIEETVETFGGLNNLVNCAGILHVKLLHEYTEEEWDRLLAVNLKSVFFSFKHAFEHLKKNTRSYVVNTASISSFIGDAAEASYDASKGGILMITKCIALDYAVYGIRCNCVAPGIVDTPLLRFHLNQTSDPEGTLAKRLKRVPMGVTMKPLDVAKAILYLSCEDSSGITGTSILVDGGLLAAAEWEKPGITAFERDERA